MKNILVSAFVLLAATCFGQHQIDSLVNIGVQYHDNGEYEKAIEVYRSALEIDPLSSLVHCELAMTCDYAGYHEEAIKHCDIALEQNTEHLEIAYVIKGTALDHLGKTEQAIEVYNQGLSEYTDSYLLLYNLAVTYASIPDYDNAEWAFVFAILNNPYHASSHYSLALAMEAQHKRIQSILGLYYFLLLEPTSERAKIAYPLLMEQLCFKAQEEDDNTMNINSPVNASGMESDFAPAELILTMIQQSNTSVEKKDKNPEELFFENTKTLFTALGELNANLKSTGFWWRFYVTRFAELATTDFLDVFCNYISMSSGAATKRGSEEKNIGKIARFAQWVNEQ